jgi:hypothetical protein
VYFRANKKHIVQRIKDWVKEVENESHRFLKGEKCQSFRFDRGQEFLSKAIEAFCKDRRIQLEPTVGCFPEVDGIVERSMTPVGYA